MLRIKHIFRSFSIILRFCFGKICKKDNAGIMNFFLHFYKILSIRFQENFKNVINQYKEISIDKILQNFDILFSVPT